MKFLFFLALFPLCVRAGVKEDFIATAQLAAEEKKECQRWKEKGLKAERDPAAPYASKSDALQALTILEAYPYQLPQAEKAADLFVQNEAELLRLSPQDDTFRYRGELLTDCEPLLISHHLPRLLSQQQKLSFSKKEMKRVDTVARKFLLAKKDSGRLSPFLQAVQISALKEYVKALGPSPQKDAWIKEAERLNDLFESERQKNLVVSGEAAKIDRNFYLRAETDLLKTLRSGYGALADQVFAKPAKRKKNS